MEYRHLQHIDICSKTAILDKIMFNNSFNASTFAKYEILVFYELTRLRDTLQQ